jgi:hypothetical protein
MFCALMIFEELDCSGERIETPSATRVEVVYGNTAGVR